MKPAPGATAQAAGDALSAYWPTALLLRAQELTLFGRTVHDVVLGGRREAGLLRASVTARELQGLVEYFRGRRSVPRPGRNLCTTVAAEHPAQRQGRSRATV